ncbi:MAG: hypothetical protein K0U23_08365, partial [Gammaproteobacteria bacterium]|nr:hypothetical protein [Gammaproteobacteria bacterium]
MTARTFNLSQLDGQNGFAINGVRNTLTGHSVSGGDFNGDNVSDIIIGAPRANLLTTAGGSGGAYMLFGHNSTWPAEVDVSSFNGSNGIMFRGPGGQDPQAGSSVAVVGDINGDGIGEILIGARYASPGGLQQAGESYLVFSRNTSWPLYTELSGLDGSNGVTIRGARGTEWSGRAVASGGDVNADGVPDIAICSRDGGYVLFGHRGNWPTIIELDSLNGTNGFFLGGRGFVNFGSSTISTAGDVNGDGISDIIINAANHRLSGVAYIVFGHTGAFPANISHADLNGANGFTIHGDHGSTSVAPVGDLNGDGVDDVLIGTPGAGPDQQGAAHAIFGHRNPWPAVVELSNLDGSDGFSMHGMQRGESFGIGVAAGDVGGDGISDMVFSALNADPNGLPNAGSVYVVFGRQGSWPASMGMASLDGTNGVIFHGIHAGDELAHSITSPGDFNGDGANDVLICSRGAGQAYVIFGGTEQFSANEIEIHLGETLPLTANHLAVNPLIGSRNFNVSNVRHGRFALATDPLAAITSFNQSQVNQSEVVFVHDGSSQAPEYTV